MKKTDRYAIVPAWKKSLLTVEEASAYTNINVGTLARISNSEDCPFVLWNGRRRLFKRKKLEEFLEKTYSI